MEKETTDKVVEEDGRKKEEWREEVERMNK